MKLVSDFLSRVFAIGMLALGIFTCAVFPFLGAKAIANENLLLEKGVVTSAVVTGQRADSRNENIVGYELQYQFRAEGGEIRYSYADILGRRNLWYTPSQAEWNAAQETNRIQVLYLPDDPWVNRPLDRSPMVDNVAVIVMGIMAGILSVYGIAVYVERRLRLNDYIIHVSPETMEAIIRSLRRIQTESSGRNSVIFILGNDKTYWIRLAGKPDSRTLYAEAADNGSLEKPFALTRKQISRLRSLGWNRPNMRKPNHYHREWWAANDGDRRRIAYQIMQTFHEVYGVDLDLPLGAYHVSADTNA